MIKKLYVLLLTGMLATGATIAQSSKLNGDYTLQIDVSSMQPGPNKLIFQYYKEYARELVKDSAAVTNTRVAFRGKLDEPVMATLLAYVPRPVQGPGTGTVAKYYYTFYLEPGKVKVVIKDSMNTVVSGSRSQVYYEKLLTVRKSYDDKRAALSKQLQAYSAAGDSAAYAKVVAQITALGDEAKEKVYKPFVIEYGHQSPVALMALKQYAGYYFTNIAEVKQLLNKIAPAYRALPAAKVLEDRIAIARKTGIGAYAMDFTQNDTLGKPVSLSSFRGKYVLLDFWASWCGPCRLENPNVVKVFNRFQHKGFTVLSISLDNPGKKDAWLKAIHDDQLTWTNVSDLAGFKNAVAKMYCVEAVPTNLLIDPQGKIVAKNLRGEALEKKLAEIFDKGTN